MTILRHKQAGEPIRIWSIPCSTGEEPYSIGMWLMENFPEVDNYKIEIVGSDIDTRALEGRGGRDLWRARADAAVQGSRRPLLRAAVTPTPTGSTRACETPFSSPAPIWSMPSDMARHRDFDIIFCRNVLIYFDDASRRIAAENLYDCLRPGGYICLGHSETMSRISPLFRVCRYADAIVYQRPEPDRDQD